MRVEEFVKCLNSEFYTGVPDSQLRPLCDYLMNEYGIGQSHIIAANEGNATALAAGYYLSTGKVPVVYMQNSGIGNIINPVASLLNRKVYAIPCIFIVGWRGEPGIHDEPQHIYQGEVTLQLLEDMEIAVYVIDKETEETDIRNKMAEFHILLQQGRSVAFVVRKGVLEYDNNAKYGNSYPLVREEVLAEISEAAGTDPMISTTGKVSRELFEIRERKGQSHAGDFLTVGSMGHCSSIALSIALNKPQKRIWCIDGDGAALMHMGAMAVIGSMKPANLIHIVMNNSAHESVGGMPTVASDIDLIGVAKACGYQHVYSVENEEELKETLEVVKGEKGTAFVEVKVSLESRKDLGRPTTTALENRINFMEYIK